MQTQLEGSRTSRQRSSSQPPPRGGARSRVPLEDIPRAPPRWREVLLAILDRHNWAHATLAKGVSFKTMEERRLFLFAFFRELRSFGYWIDPRSLGTRHLQVMLEAWLSRGLSASTVQRYLSHVRVFCEWIGKPGMVPDLSKLTATPERFQRTYVAQESKSWPDKGAVAADLFTRADALDAYVGSQLRMQQAFGLRVKEALMLQPHSSVIVSGGQSVLVVKRGTKGGRRREVSIDSEAKREALAHAQTVCTSVEQSLADPTRTLLQAYHRFFYVMKQLGVTRAQLGVTAHGLRHGFAAAEYEARAGEPPPVREGGCVDRDTDTQARLAVAEQLGHARKQISGAYLGGLLRSGQLPPTTTQP